MGKVVALPVRPRRQPLLPNGVLGMLLFVLAEVMLFAGLISAFLVVKGLATEWPPVGQPRLPARETAVNTAALLLSGAVLARAQGRFRRAPGRALRPLLLAVGLGAFFVVFQGVEWVALVREGLTLTSSAHGGFFYLIVGLHALHAVGAILALGWAALRLAEGHLSQETFAAVQVFWYFVVGLWPILYWQVYF